MSRIGNAPINLPDGVEVSISPGNLVTVKGSKGTLYQQINPDITVKIEDGVITVSRPTDQKRHRALHGLYRSLISNCIEGVSQGFVKELELYGVGFRASNSGQLLELMLGFSHPVYFYLPDEVKVETEMEKGKPPLIRISGNDKQLVGQIAAKIRAIRKPEPYKGKGVRYKGEEIRRKAGKTAG